MTDKTFQKNTKQSFKLVKNDVDEFKNRMDLWVRYFLQRIEQLEAKVTELDK